MDFSLPPEIDALRLKVRAFVAENILPLEADRSNYDAHENIRLEVLGPLRSAGFNQQKSPVLIYRTRCWKWVESKWRIGNWQG